MFTFFLIWFLTIIVNSAFADFDPTKHENWNLLDNENCGAPKTARIIGGDIVKLGEFPWMARLVFAGINSCDSMACGGFIANNKTILTAAHCVTYLRVGCRVSEIVLGDWNKGTDPDCENDVCSVPIQTIKPEDIIFHSAYKEFINDIAIIRLKTEIQYNPYVRPICIPKGSLMQSSFLGNNTVAAGWGIMNSQKKYVSSMLRKVDLPVVDFDACQKAFNDTDSTKQMCVGGEWGKDTCNGDSGGPLMLLASENETPRYYAIGILSFGHPDCGKNKPSVFTRLTTYVEWILDNLKENKKDFRFAWF